MATEKTVELKFKVSDEGSLKLETIKTNLGKVTSEVSNMDKSLRLIKLDSIINLAERAYQAAREMYNFGKSIASAANDIERQSRIMGISTTEYQKLTYAAKMSDLAIETFTTGIGIFSSKLEDATKGTGDVRKYLRAMGIEIESTTWKTMTLSEKIGEIAESFKGWIDGEKKIAIARELFGRSGAEWIEMLNKGKEGIANYGEELVKMKGVLGEVTLKAGSAAENEFKKLDTQFNSLKITLSPLILKFAELATNIAEAAVNASIFNKEGKEMELKNLEAGLAYGIKEGVSVKFIESYTKRILELKKELGLFYETALAISHGPGYISTYGKTQPPTIPVENKARLEAEKRAREAIADEIYKMSDFYQYEENVRKGLIRSLDLEKSKREEILKIQERLNDLGRSALKIMEGLGIVGPAHLKDWIKEMTKDFETVLGSDLFSEKEIEMARKAYISSFEWAKGPGGWKDMSTELDDVITKFERMTSQDTEAAKLKIELSKLEDEVKRLASVVSEPMKIDFDISPAKGALDDLWIDFNTIREEMLKPIPVVINITGTGSSEMPIMDKIDEIYGGFEGMSAYISNLKFQMNLSAINAQIEEYQGIIRGAAINAPSFWRIGEYSKYIRGTYNPELKRLEEEKSILMQAQAYSNTRGVSAESGGGVSININTMNVYGATSEEMVVDMDEQFADLWKKNRSELKVAMTQ